MVGWDHWTKKNSNYIKYMILFDQKRLIKEGKEEKAECKGYTPICVELWITLKNFRRFMRTVWNFPGLCKNSYKSKKVLYVEQRDFMVNLTISWYTYCK
jgi:hypothetical protein